MTENLTPTVAGATWQAKPAGSSSFLYERLLIVGVDGGTHIGGAFYRAAIQLGVPTALANPERAYSRSRIVNALTHRFFDKRPAHLARFEDDLLAQVKAFRPSRVLVIGSAPVSASLLDRLRAPYRKVAFFSSDDPWNRRNGSARLMKALPLYDFIFSPRLSAIPDFASLGCPSVHYLPFGAEEDMIHKGPLPLPEHDEKFVLFVGGADSDRIRFFERFVSRCGDVKLGGDYWRATSSLKRYALGVMSREQVIAETGAAAVSICLSRRANRDGHVMRTFEIMARGGCMLAEDTPEHREILGPENERVVYFDSPELAAVKANSLLGDAPRRRCLREKMLLLACSGKHSYAHRVRTMLEIMEQSQ